MAYVRLCLVTLSLCFACGSNVVDSGGGGTGGTAPSAGAPGSSGGSSSSAGAHSGGSGGHAVGGATGSGGGAGVEDCATLKSDYSAAVDQARVCDAASTDECSPNSTLPTLLGCGCPTPVNAKSPSVLVAQQKYQAIQDAKCLVGPVCNIACLAYTSVTCSSGTATSGTADVCTSSNTPTN
jgi:hypothetical protein